MASEFDFLRAKWPKLAAIAADASRLVDIIPSSAMKSLEKYSNWCADIALDVYEIQVSGGASQLQKLEALQASGFVPVEVLQRFHNVRTAAGRSVADVNSATDLANACLSDCRNIGQWLFREANKEGFISNQKYSPEYNVPISGMKSHMPEAESMSSEYKLNRFMRQYGSYITLFFALLVIGGTIFGISRLFKSKGEEAKVPEYSMVATPMATHTPGPASVEDSLVEPIEDAELEYVLIDDLPIAVNFNSAHLSTRKWDYKKKQDPFQSSNQIYESGLGMFLFSDTISEEWGRDDFSYNLNGKYEKIQFDLFADSSWSYGNSSEYGQYRVYMYADGVKIFESDARFYDDFIDDKIVPLPPGTLQLEIRISQKKGSVGTLGVVLGDFFLYPYPKEPDPTPTPTAAPTDAPTDAATDAATQ